MVNEDKVKERKVPVRAVYLFPAYELGAALKIAEAVEIGGGGQLSESTLAVNLQSSAKSSGFRLKCLTARQFGLLRKQGENLFTTPLAKAIFKPMSDGEKVNALKSAFLQIPLFKAIATRFKGQPLPQGQPFRNILERELRLEPGRIGAAERVFLDSAHDAGVLQTSGGNIYLMAEDMSTGQVGGIVPLGAAGNDKGSSQGGTIPPIIETPRPGIHSSGTGAAILISEQDLAEFENDEFNEVWTALGKVFRARGKRQLARGQAEMGQQNGTTK